MCTYFLNVALQISQASQVALELVLLARGLTLKLVECSLPPLETNEA